jgi:predicted protein tyrosine phosphatase
MINLMIVNLKGDDPDQHRAIRHTVLLEHDARAEDLENVSGDDHVSATPLESWPTTASVSFVAESGHRTAPARSFQPHALLAEGERLEAAHRCATRKRFTCDYRGKRLNT